VQDPDQRCILFATASPEDEARTEDIPYMRSIEELGRAVLPASELNPAPSKYCCCLLGRSDKPLRARLIREPAIEYN